MTNRSGNELYFLVPPAVTYPYNWLQLLAFLAGVLLVVPASAQTSLEEELECLALTIYFEARGESVDGRIAVGHVVLNRVSDPDFPEAVCGVVRQGGESTLYRCQFTWWCDGLSDQPKDMASWRQCRQLARLIYFGYTSDPTDSALWYHADYVEPPWANILVRGPTIGRHIFYGREETPLEDEPQDGVRLASTAADE